MSPFTAPLARWGGPFASRSLLRTLIHSLPLSPQLRPPNDPLRHADALLSTFDRLQLHDADPLALLKAAQDAPNDAALADLAGAYAEWIVLKERSRVRDPCDVMQLALRASREGSGAAVRHAQERWSEVILPDSHNLGVPTTTLLWHLFGREVRESSRGVRVTCFAAPQLEAAPDGRATALLKRASSAATGAGPNVEANASNPTAAFARALWCVHTVVGSDAAGPLEAAKEHDSTASVLAIAQSTAGVQDAQTISLSLEHGAHPRAVTCVSVDSGADRLAVLVRVLEAQISAAPSPAHRTRRRSLGVLCQTAAQARTLTASLQDAVVQHGWSAKADVVGDSARRLVDVPGVRAVVAALSVAVAPQSDNRALFALGSGAPYNISEVELASLLHVGAAAPGVSAHAAATLESLRKHVAEALLAYKRTGSVVAYIAAFLRRSGLSVTLTNGVGGNDEASAAAVEELLRLVQQLEAGATLSSVGGGRAQRTPSHGSGSEVHRQSAAASASTDAAGGVFTVDANLMGTLPTVLSQLLELLTSLRVNLSHADSFSPTPDADDDSAYVSYSTAADILDEASVADVRRAAASDKATNRLVTDVEAEDTSSQVGHPRLTIVVTSLSRGLQFQFDSVVFPWLLDSSLPGSLRLPSVAPPKAFLQPPLELRDDFAVEPSTSSARARAEHVDWQRQRFNNAMSCARESVIIIAPSASASHPLRYQRRSRFIDELFGPVPRDTQCSLPRKRASVNKGAVSEPLLVSANPALSPPGLGSDREELRFSQLALPDSGGDAPAERGTAEDLPHSAPCGTQTATHHAGAADALPLLPLSFSRLYELQICPRRYYYGRVLCLQQSSSAARLYGHAMHTAVAAFSMSLRQIIMRSFVSIPAADASRIPGLSSDVASRSSGTLGLLEEGAAVAFRLLRDPLFRATVRAELPNAEAATGMMLAEYDGAWSGKETAGPRFSTAPSELAALVAHAVDPTPLVIPELQRLDLDRCAHSGLADFARRELDAADAFLRDPERSSSLGSGWLGFPALVEHPFVLDLPEAGVCLRGVFDRIDVNVSAGVGATPTLASVSVREFKSSVQWAPPDALRKRARSNLQLQTYSLALHAQAPPASLYPLLKWDLPSSLVLESIETGERAELKRARTAATVEQARAVTITGLAAAAAEIRGGEFTATPSSFACSTCPFKSVCTKKHAWA